jgi:predicted DNA-binding transcriptional regulator AlpA
MAKSGSTAGESKARIPAQSMASALILMLTYRQVANHIQVSTRWIRRAVESGRFPPPDVRSGRIVRWSMNTLTNWISTNAKKNESNVSTKVRYQSEQI